MDADEPGHPGDVILSDMLVAVAGQAITGYLQFQALAELLIARGVITRDELEAHYRVYLAHELAPTIRAWFPPEVAARVLQAVAAQSPDDGEAPPPAGARPHDVEEG